MTPRELDIETVVNRLRTMRRLLEQLGRLRDGDVPGDEFGRRLQLERILSALVDLAVAINTHVVVTSRREAPHDMTGSFRMAAEVGLIDADLATAIAPSVGLRNVIVHAYVDLDVGRMTAAVPAAVEQYGRYVEQVARWVRARSS